MKINITKKSAALVALAVASAGLVALRYINFGADSERVPSRARADQSDAGVWLEDNRESASAPVKRVLDGAPAIDGESRRTAKAAEYFEGLTIDGFVQSDVKGLDPASFKVIAWWDGSLVDAESVRSVIAGGRRPNCEWVSVGSDGYYRISIPNCQSCVVGAISAAGCSSLESIAVGASERDVTQDLRVGAVVVAHYKLIDAATGKRPRAHIASQGGQNSHRIEGVDFAPAGKGHANPFVRFFLDDLDVDSSLRRFGRGVNVYQAEIIRTALSFSGALPSFEDSVHLPGYEPEVVKGSFLPLDRSQMRVVSLAPTVSAWGSLSIVLDGDSTSWMPAIDKDASHATAVLRLTSTGGERAVMFPFQLGAQPATLPVPAGEYLVTVRSSHDLGRCALDVSARLVSVEPNGNARLTVSYAGLGHIAVLSDFEFEKGSDPVLLWIGASDGDGVAWREVSTSDMVLRGMSPGSYDVRVVSRGALGSGIERPSIPVEVVEESVTPVVVPGV